MKAVNLIPAEQRRAKPTGKSSGVAYVAIGLLSVLLAMTVAYVLTSNKVNENQTKAAEAGQEADALEAQAAQMGSFTNFAAIKEQRLVSVVTTAQTRFDWERMMREVSRIMPEGSWLRTTDASVLGSDEAAAAQASSGLPPVGPASPAATFVGCTRKQSEVATLMVRMRQMYRVSDVELNASSQESADTEASLDTCGQLYQFDVTVTFEPVAPTKEAPRGSVRVPASLGGGS
jgi:Tfp pilus assembly protein PilN